jgi:hypothetical protein
MKEGTMKKPPLIVAIVLLLAVPAAAESRFFLAGGANYIRPSDEGYRSIYGGQAFFPEISGALRLVAGLCLTGSWGEFAKNGVTPVLGFETRASQGYFTAGLGYLLRLSNLICLEAGAGIAGLTFREDALGTYIQGRRRGTMAEGGLLIIPEDGRVLLGVKVGYLSARLNDLDPAMAGNQSVRLGGLKFALSVGIQLFGEE